MPKTLNIANGPHTRSAAAPDRTAPDRAGQKRAIMLFMVAYIAILGVLFAPKGFFLAEPEATVLAE